MSYSGRFGHLLGATPKQAKRERRVKNALDTLPVRDDDAIFNVGSVCVSCRRVERGASASS